MLLFVADDALVVVALPDGVNRREKLMQAPRDRALEAADDGSQVGNGSASAGRGEACLARNGSGLRSVTIPWTWLGMTTNSPGSTARKWLVSSSQHS